MALAGCGSAPDLLRPLDADHTLAPDEVPGDLAMVPTRLRVRPERVRAVALAPLIRMLDAARAAGVELWVSSGFRSFARQQVLFDEGDPLVAPPGQSEHQLGTAVDLATGWTTVLEGGDAYAWMDAHAWRYGWINSYPDSGTPVEPWHWRFVGEDAAARWHANYVETGVRASAAELIRSLREP